VRGPKHFDQGHRVDNRSHPNKAVDVVANNPPGNRLSFLSDQNRFLFLNHHAKLRSSVLRCLRERAVAERLIDLAAHPESMK
jgi:hypothetical protein